MIVTEVPRKLIQKTIKATDADHVMIMLGVNDVDLAEKVTTHVVEPMHDYYREHALRRIEATLIKRSNEMGLTVNGGEITNIDQVSYCCFEEDFLASPEHYEIVWKIFFGMDSYCLHGATTWEREMLTSQGVVYCDGKALGEVNTKSGKPTPHQGINAKFGKPTPRQGGFLQSIFSVAKSMVQKRSIHKKQKGDWRVANSLSGPSSARFKYLKRGHGFNPALNITYQGEPFAVVLLTPPTTGPTATMMQFYMAFKNIIDLSPLVVHADYNTFTDAENLVDHPRPDLNSSATTPLGPSPVLMENITEAEWIRLAQIRNAEAEAKKKKESEETLKPAPSQKKKDSKEKKSLAAPTVASVTAMVALEETEAARGEDSVTQLRRLSSKVTPSCVCFEQCWVCLQ